MDFGLTEEQVSFQKLFRTFAQKAVAPVAAEIDHAGALDAGVWRQAAEQGFLGAVIPEAYGGAALDLVSYCLLVEELGRVCVSTALAVAIHNSFMAGALVDAGTDAQKEQYLPQLAAGEISGGLAITAPEAGSDALTQQTHVVRTGDEYVLNGVKTWVTTTGNPAFFIVVAATTPKARRKGQSLFIVPADAPGLTLSPRESTLGLRALSIYSLYLEDCRVPASALLGPENEGWPVIAHCLERMRLMLAAAGLGAAEGSLELGRQFAVTRKQFGVSIATKQALGNYFADTRLEIEALRQMVYYTAWQIESGAEFATTASMVKLLAAQTARNAANRMLQVHGGYGFSEEYAISRMYRDVRVLSLMGGTDQIQRVLIAQDVFAGTGVEIAP